jgi:uncharacterized cupin superfamily protein
MEDGRSCGISGVAPYHIHNGNEGLLLVLSGTPQLRTPDGVRTLEAGAMVAFLARSGGSAPDRQSLH